MLPLEEVVTTNDFTYSDISASVAESKVSKYPPDPSDVRISFR
jgi:hypothetical protein